MELEVGMYVRTNTGEIGKYYINNNGINMLQTRNNKIYVLWKILETYKYSHNIIDLIKVGDLVKLKNGIVAEVSAVYDDKLLFDGLDCFWYEDEIKSVITKEQFQSLEFKVGE